VSDLLDSVRAVNPVISCEQPSMEDVWRKLAQGETGASTQTGLGRRNGDARQRSAHRDWFGRRPTGAGWRRGAVVLSAVVAATVVVLAAVGRQAGVDRTGSARLPQPSAAVRRLANGTISCDFTATGVNRGPAVSSVSARGRSPIVFCRDRYLAIEHRSAHASAVRFIACETSAVNVAVYISDGRPNQCGRRGDRALPAGYAAALRRSGLRATAVSSAENTGDLSV